MQVKDTLELSENVVKVIMIKTLQPPVPSALEVSGKEAE